MTSAIRIDGYNGPIAKSISNKLLITFQPSYLQVINESHTHNVPPNSESHFKVVVVSVLFQNKSILDRHRLVNECLKEDLQAHIHALSIVPKTPEQWAQASTVADSPKCLGGSKK